MKQILLQQHSFVKARKALKYASGPLKRTANQDGDHGSEAPDHKFHLRVWDRMFAAIWGHFLINATQGPCCTEADQRGGAIEPRKRARRCAEERVNDVPAE
jgi:hypothetical protein